MMPQSVICTVGISLLTNMKYRASDDPVRIAVENRNAISTAVALRGKDADAAKDAAEINSTQSLVSEQILSEPAALYLIVSDSDDGRFVGETLRRYYGQTFKDIEVVNIPGLVGDNLKVFRNQGLRNLAHECARRIDESRKADTEPLINATGGYKAQISFAGLIGQILQVPVYYQYEDFGKVIELPPMPIAFDERLWWDNLDLLMRLDRDYISQDDPDLQKIEPRLQSLMVFEDGHYTTSATGALFVAAFRPLLAAPATQQLANSTMRPEDKKINHGDGHHRPKGIEQFFTGILQQNYVESIYTYALTHILGKRFRLSASDVTEINGSYSDGAIGVCFTIRTTAKDAPQQQVALASLWSNFSE